MLICKKEAKMKVISWNINGLKNILSKNREGDKKSADDVDVLTSLISQEDPDILCLQEVRHQNPLELLTSKFGNIYNYIYVSIAAKKGYSGTAILSKKQPISVSYPEINDEGRIIIAKYNNLVVITVYTPNSKPKLERLDYRCQQWEPEFRKLVADNNKSRHIIVCGDFNVAHTEKDIYSPNTNKKHAGFTDNERISFGLLLHNLNLIDTFRLMNPLEFKYSWWSNFHNSRENNKGWRIDYVLTHKSSINKITNADILTDFYGSDHAPVKLTMDFYI